MSDAVDKAEPKAKGRNKLTNQVSPQGAANARWAKEQREAKDKNPVIESWYELRKNKLSLVKKKANGSTYRVFVGSLEDKERGASLKAQVESMQKEDAGKPDSERKLRTRV